KAVPAAYERMLARSDDQLVSLHLAVDLVPRMRLPHGYTQWPADVAADGKVPLARLIPAGVDPSGSPTRPRLIVFRRPVEMRARSKEERADMLRYIVTRLVAHYLNVGPETIDPRTDWER